MGNMAKQKGKRGERDFSLELHSLLGNIRKRREAGQKATWEFGPQAFVDPQANGADIQSIEGLSIEVKRQETLNLKLWWSQTERQADDLGAIPVLAFRQNRKAWKVCLPAYLLGLEIKGYIICELSTFEDWLYQFLDR